MKLIDEKYSKLTPRVEKLRDEVVIAQAWKKSHTYIRNHNWYADSLALDMSSLDIEDNASRWAKKENYTPRGLELVPAAKSAKGDVSRGWQLSADENLKIRPLAHILVREQTMATATMMCLADAVETAQGDCSEQDFIKAQRKCVYNYGNRLLCDWNDTSAWFRWGNSDTYRKFFTDYQSFLKRPISIGREVAESDVGLDNVFVISLDIKSFYDEIEIDSLIRKLKDISNKYYSHQMDEGFWIEASKILAFSWSQEALKEANSE